MIHIEQSRILVVDDDKEIREIIRILFTQEGYDVSKARDERETLEHMNDRIDLYILDIIMPYTNRYELYEQIRKHSNTPILFPTVRGTQKDKAQGFFKGADDYPAGPFSYSELLVRAKAMLRRSMAYQGKRAEIEKCCRISQIRDTRIEERGEAVYVKGEKIVMADLEYQLLYLIAAHKNQTFSAGELFVFVQDEPYFTSANNTLMVHIRNVRKKIEEDTRSPKYIKTIWGKGYRSE